MTFRTQFLKAAREIGFLRSNFAIISKGGRVFVCSILNNKEVGNAQCLAVLNRLGLSSEWKEEAINDIFGNPAPAFQVGF